VPVDQPNQSALPLPPYPPYAPYPPYPPYPPIVIQCCCHGSQGDGPAGYGATPSPGAQVNAAGPSITGTGGSSLGGSSGSGASYDGLGQGGSSASSSLNASGPGPAPVFNPFDPVGSLIALAAWKARGGR
jgi:hypothetical protein